MRKRTVRNGMRLIVAALIMIILASFYHTQFSDFLSLSASSESLIYRNGMFWAAAIGGYGVVVTVLGCILSPRKNDAGVRLFPVFMGILALIFFFFYLLSDAMDTPDRYERRVMPGETITI